MIPFFKHLDEFSDITDITFNDRKRFAPLDKFSQIVLRGNSPFTESEREIFAAFISGLNECDFCYGSHKAVANNFGIQPTLIESLLEDIEKSKINDKLKPILKYIKKLTLTPSRLTQFDVEKVYQAGWSEQALYDAICICCLFNFHNRLLDGHGIKGNDNIYHLGGEHLYKNGYGVPWFIGLIKKSIRNSKIKKLQNMQNFKIKNNNIMTEKKILVLGGTGKTGRRVAKRLFTLGKDIRIGSRNESPSFDWENPETWTDVLNGIDSVYITFQPDLAVPSAVPAIEAFTSLAVKQGVQKMVLLSGRGEKEAQACEQIVMNAGADWTIVRSDWFNQNFSESFFLDPIQAGHVALPRGEALIPFVDNDDIADVVVEALLNDKHNGQIYELTGPRLLTFEQATSEISRATGRDIQFHSITMDEYTGMLREHHVPEDFIWLVKYLFTEVLDGRNSTVTNDIEKVLGRKAKDFADYAKNTATTGIWAPLKKSMKV